MSNISTDTLSIAPGVVETIVSIALRDVDGVAVVGNGDATFGIRNLLTQKQEVPGISVVCNDEGALEVVVALTVVSGYSLEQIADQVRTKVSDALRSQVGIPVARVDLYIDGIQFKD